MILRKPYAFFIKYFRVFHIILSLMMAFLIYKTHKIFSFYNNYIASSQLFNANGITNTLYSTFFILLPILIIIVSLVILIVLYNKKKKYTFYALIIIFYILMFVLILYSRNVTYQLEKGAIDLRILKSIKDFYFIGYIAQFIFILVTIIRAIGFDIKKFDFVSDLKKLDITEEDREEFELSLSFDTNKAKRNLNKRIRDFKYFYKERKLLINSIIFIIVCSIGLVVFLNIREGLSFISEKENFSTGGFSYIVENSYITNKDYKNSAISEDNYLVIVNLHINNNNTSKPSLNSSYYELKIEDNVYYHTTKYNDKIFDLGTGYNGENIDEGVYAFIFEIPKEEIDKDIVFRVFSGIDKDNKKTYKQVKLSPITYSKEENIAEIGKSIIFNRGIFNGSTITITNVELAKNFALNYNFCIDTECFASTEIVQGRINTNYDKALIKIKGNLDSDYDFCNFLYNFGRVRYTNSDGNSIIKGLNAGIIVPTKVKLSDTCFLEIPLSVLDYEEIKLEINVRNETIKYAIMQQN